MATGVTFVRIEHPTQDVPLPNLDVVGNVVAVLHRVINGVAIGAALPGTRVYVAQGGAQASGTVTLSGVGGTAASGTIIYASSSGTTTATVNGVAFEQTTGDDVARGIALAAAINASLNVAIDGVLSATDDGAGEVTITADAKGTGGNAITLAVSGTGIARSAATLENGANGSVTVTVNGTAEATTTTNLTDAASATLVAAELNANTTINDYVSAEAEGAVVTITALEYGVTGNLYTLVSTSATGTATRSGATLAGGTEPTGQYLERP